MNLAALPILFTFAVMIVMALGMAAQRRQEERQDDVRASAVRTLIALNEQMMAAADRGDVAEYDQLEAAYRDAEIASPPSAIFPGGNI